MSNRYYTVLVAVASVAVLAAIVVAVLTDEYDVVASLLGVVALCSVLVAVGEPGGRGRR